jgi:hypothetical protein
VGVTELHVIVPGICGPLCETESLKQSDTVRQWVQHLCRSEEQASYGNLDETVAGIFSLPTGEGDLPSAALLMKANHRYAADRYYIQAAPVHLQADLDHAVLTPAADISISEEEATALCEALNKHFNEDGLSFDMLSKDQWVVSSTEEILITTTSLSEAVGRNINFLLPRGETSASWKKILTEAQMLMHSHEVNNRRDDSGLLTINSLWFYGAGRLPGIQDKGLQEIATDKSEGFAICSRDDIFKGIAAEIGCDFQQCVSVEKYIDYLRTAGHAESAKRKNVLHLPALEHVVNYTDVMLWRQHLEELLTLWIYPLMSYAVQHDIRMVLYPCNGKQYRFSKHDRWKFWRRGEISTYIHSFEDDLVLQG